MINSSSGIKDYVFAFRNPQENMIFIDFRREITYLFPQVLEVLGGIVSPFWQIIK